MGERDETIETIVQTRYFWSNIFFQLKILLAALIVGASIGSGAWAVSRLLKINDFYASISAIAFWGLVQIDAITRHPQFYDGPFLDQRGWLKEIVFYPARNFDPRHTSLAVALIGAILLIGAIIYALALLRSRRRYRYPIIAICAIGAFIALARAIPFDRAIDDPAARPNILLIVIDSLRADRLSVNGYHRDTTANIDRIARAGALFSNVKVDAPRTFPSWVSMMTGRYPFEHGLRNMFPRPADKRLIYPPLPKVLADAGYQTIVVSDFAGDIFPRIDFGFERVNAPTFSFDTLVKMGGLEIHPTLFPFFNTRIGRAIFPSIRELAYNSDPMRLTEEAERELDRLDRGRPWMMALFFSTSHLPYAPPGPYFHRYSDPNYRGALSFQNKNLLMRETLDSESDLAQINALYDGALKSIDDSIARLIARLDKTGEREKTLIFITGDHGEAFYEHGGEIGHGNHLRGPYASTVPLVIYDPRGQSRPRSISAQTRLIDLAPTIADLIGIEFESARGKSLRSYLDGSESADRIAYSETGLWYLADGPFFFQKERIRYPSISSLLEIDWRFDSDIIIKKKYRAITADAKHRAISDGRYKLIYIPSPRAARYELYDLKRDPAEKIDISSDRPDLVRRYARELKELVGSGPTDRIVGDRILNVETTFLPD